MFRRCSGNRVGRNASGDPITTVKPPLHCERASLGIEVQSRRALTLSPRCRELPAAAIGLTETQCWGALPPERPFSAAARCLIDADAISSASHASRAFSADSTSISPGMCGSHFRSIFNATKASMILYSSLPMFGSIRVAFLSTACRCDRSFCAVVPVVLVPVRRQTTAKFLFRCQRIDQRQDLRRFRGLVEEAVRAQAKAQIPEFGARVVGEDGLDRRWVGIELLERLEHIEAGSGVQSDIDQNQVGPQHGQ